jgi:branched-subunit amino acid aminotransferase/4-amino-4-deoxychorismate lyase
LKLSVTDSYYFLEGKQVQEVPASLAFSNSGFLWSQSAFTTALIENGRLLFYEEHLDRLESTYEWLSGIKISRKEIGESIKKAFHEISEETKKQSWRIRVTLFKDSSGRIVQLFTFSHLIEKHMPVENLKVVQLPLKRSYKSENIKLADYGETFRLKNIYQSELLLCDESGIVSEASIANIIFFDGGDWYTPKSEGAIFKGIGLSYGLKGIPIKEKKIHVDNLDNYKAALLVNSVRGVVPVLRIDENILALSLEMRERVQNIFDENSNQRSNLL